MDILGAPKVGRCERHERIVDWLHRLRNAGFTPLYYNGALPRGEEGMVEAVSREDHVALRHDGIDIVSIVCARPE